MTKLIWGAEEDKFYEYGVSKGALYGDEGLFSPWNGIVSVEESYDGSEITETFFDSKKISVQVSPGSYEATVNAYTFPDNFLSYVGFMSNRPGVVVTNQPIKVFNFSYQVRTNETGYKIHLVEKVVAARSPVSNKTISGSLEPNILSFTLKPTRFKSENYFNPSSHIVIDSTKASPSFLSFVENKLYGTSSSDPEFVTKEDILAFV